VYPSWKKRERRNVWFHTKLTMVVSVRGLKEAFLPVFD
jgi:hypothetical protein